MLCPLFLIELKGFFFFFLVFFYLPILDLIGSNQLQLYYTGFSRLQRLEVIFQMLHLKKKIKKIYLEIIQVYQIAL